MYRSRAAAAATPSALLRRERRSEPLQELERAAARQRRGGGVTLLAAQIVGDQGDHAGLGRGLGARLNPQRDRGRDGRTAGLQEAQRPEVEGSPGEVDAERCAGEYGLGAAGAARAHCRTRTIRAGSSQVAAAAWTACGVTRSSSASEIPAGEDSPSKSRRPRV